MTNPQQPTTATEPPTYYEILRVSPHATFEVIKSSHRHLAKLYHPDKNQDSAKIHAEQFHRLQDAWECLRDATKRKEYDEQLKRNYYQWNSRRQSAIKIPLSQFEQVAVMVDTSYDVKHDSFQNLDEHERQVPRTLEHKDCSVNIEGDDHHDQEILYLYTCRCGQEMELWADQVPKRDGLDDVLFDCAGCSNVFCVVNDSTN